jgi:drug/metabolite transporter (DMT)-like permease
MNPSGVALCVSSAAAYGVMGIFGKLAYDEGATVGTLLATRFVVAAVLFWLVAVGSGRTGELRTLPRRDTGLAVALGAVGFGAQATGYFTALGRIDASLLSLLVYTYPVIVAVAAVALGRDRASRRTAVALTIASAGLVLVLAGAASGALDPVGTALGLGTAVVYSVYVLVSESLVSRLSPLSLSTLVCTGAAVSLTVGAATLGQLHPERVSLAGFGWLAVLAVVSTVVAVGLFFAGLRRVGPTAASILSTVEPLVTVVLACLLFRESFGPVQIAGAGLVLLAVLAVQTSSVVARSGATTWTRCGPRRGGRGPQESEGPSRQPAGVRLA